MHMLAQLKSKQLPFNFELFSNKTSLLFLKKMNVIWLHPGGNRHPASAEKAKRLILSHRLVSGHHTCAAPASIVINAVLSSGKRAINGSAVTACLMTE